MPEPVLDEPRLRRLIDAGRGLISNLEVDAILQHLLDVAREVTGARYAAVGVLDDRREALGRFVTAGVDEATHRAIGDLPRGRGILGLLIAEPRPLRLADLGEHPRSYGFPPGHPPMRGFLGVPILIRGEAWGNLYLTEKADGEFDHEDEDAVVVLADWAAIAIENARLYRAVDARRAELERAVRGFEATATIARAVGGETDLERVLELIVKRGRALVEARDVLILPLVYRGTTLGALLAFDRLTGDVGFTRDDVQLLEAFAASAATAVATAKTVEADRLRKSLEAAEAERRRWARELHDETLQALGGLKVLLSSASRLDDAAAMREAMDQAVGHVASEIENLRALIAELRPPALDQLGLEPALASLVQRTETTSGLEIAADVRLGGDEHRLAPELETTVYRIVQEALTNVVKHARARRVEVV